MELVFPLEDLPLILLERRNITCDIERSLIDIFEQQDLLSKFKIFHEDKQVHVACSHAREFGARNE